MQLVGQHIGYGHHKHLGRERSNQFCMEVEGAVVFSPDAPNDLRATWTADYLRTPRNGNPESQAHGELVVAYQGLQRGMRYFSQFGRQATIEAFTADGMTGGRPVYGADVPHVAEALLLAATSRMPKDGTINWNVSSDLYGWARGHGFEDSVAFADTETDGLMSVAARVGELRQHLRITARELGDFAVKLL